MARGFNVGRFRAAIDEKKVQRPNLFLAEFLVPPGMQQQNMVVVQRLEYWVEVTSMPGLNINTYPGLRFGYGAPEFRAQVNTFVPCNFEIIFDGQADNYNFFYEWMKLIVNNDARDGINPGNGATGNDEKDPFELSYRDDYLTDTAINLYNQEGQAVARTVMRESFPASIGEMKLGWSDNNSYMRLPISMVYTDWYSDITNPDIPTIGS